MTEMKKQILELLEKNQDKFTSSEISDHLVCAICDVKPALNELIADGSVASSRNGRDVVYWAKAISSTKPKEPPKPAPKIETTAPKQPIATQKKKPVKRSKPFTPNGTVGYLAENGKVRVFLERKASSRTITFTIGDLHELVNAVQKADSVTNAI